MDKKALQEQFEEFARWYVLPLDKSEDGIYRALETQSAWAACQHQQAKVEELKATIKGNHGRIAELERLNRVKAQAIIDLHQEITELKASHHGEVIGHEVHFKKIKQERDELQTLCIQQGINMLKLQKRVDKALELMQKPVIVGEPTNYVCARFKELEQALKGEGQ
ncbi:hypothetical protein [Acinetobacter sp. 1245593]|uniref:hypothetical protein n=1 Tax=Acinetobacter sp. 1245593 TaxID=1310728 RepID=UPI00044B9A40|nr:hypothetical protein [Acinetobacter sp. 1245593]EXH15108.1 hypothetical protein J627_1339 [Acinetobacter sp. 1245593]